MHAQYRLRPACEGDLPLLAEWSSRPHISRWFGGDAPGVDELHDARIAMWIVMLGSRPFAYVQDYDVHGWSPHHFDFLPPGSRGIDMYIGDLELLGLGHGSELLRQHASALIGRGAPALGIDPHPNNHAAVRANRKAGFVIASGPIETPWGRVILMTRSSSSSKEGCPCRS